MQHKKLLIFISLLLALVGVNATLYGISKGHTRLSAFDPTTGAVAPFGPELVDIYTSQQLASVDEKNNIYYFIGKNTSEDSLNLVGLNLKNGEPQYVIPLPLVTVLFLGYGETCNVDTRNGDVYVSGKEAPGTNKTHTVFRITPKTGKISTLLKIDADDLMSGSASAFDAANNLLWLELGTGSSIPNLFAINVDSGKFKILDNKYVMQSMAYDRTTKLVTGIGLRIDDVTQSYYRTIVTVDGATGEMKSYGKLGNYTRLLANLSPLDYKNRLMYSAMSPDNVQDLDLVTVNVDTGSVVTGITIDRNKLPWSIEYVSD